MKQVRRDQGTLPGRASLPRPGSPGPPATFFAIDQEILSRPPEGASAHPFSHPTTTVSRTAFARAALTQQRPPAAAHSEELCRPPVGEPCPAGLALGVGPRRLASRGGGDAREEQGTVPPAREVVTLLSLWPHRTMS
jgi:hypothetical protein